MGRSMGLGDINQFYPSQRILVAHRSFERQDRSGAVREDLMKYIERGEFIDRSGI